MSSGSDEGNREIMYHALHVSTEETVVKSFGKKVIGCKKNALNFVILVFLLKASFSFSKADMLINKSHCDHGDYTDAFF